jgi:hypothetical protein
MEFQFRDLAFQPEQETPVDRGWVVDPVPIADEATAVAAQVEDLIPVGAIACHPGDIVGENDADLVEGDPGDDLLEAVPALRGPCGPAPVSVDDLDGLGSPAALKGSLLERELEATALLVGEDLVRAGLADVDKGQAAEVERGDEFGDAHG